MAAIGRNILPTTLAIFPTVFNIPPSGFNVSVKGDNILLKVLAILVTPPSGPNAFPTEIGRASCRERV